MVGLIRIICLPTPALGGMWGIPLREFGRYCCICQIGELRGAEHAKARAQHAGGVAHISYVQRLSY
jgi:hypothetical protein